MGLFDKFVKKEEGIEAEPGKIYAPIKGKYIAVQDIPDPVFSSGAVGKGCGIEPTEEKVYAPVTGTASMVADTKHGIGITTKEGAEFLIHVGIDTVDMQGKGFDVKIKQGDSVKAGQLLMTFSMDAIRAAGHPVCTAFLLTNPDEYEDFEIYTGKDYAAKEEAGRI